MATFRKISVLAGVLGLALAAFGPAHADNKPLKIIFSSPQMAFPFFVHMAKQIQDEAIKLGDIEIAVTDGQGSSPKQTADIEAAVTQGIDGIVISPNDVDTMAPAIQQVIDAGIPMVTIDRRVERVPGILAHVGADNVKGGEAQGELVLKAFPNGATIMNFQGRPGSSPAIDRNQGLHNVLDAAGDRYRIVFEDTALFQRDKGLSVTELALAGMETPPDVIVAANDDMALGAMEAVKARNLTGKIAIIGFDALPEAIAQVRDGGLMATIERMPGGQSRRALDTLVAFLRDDKKPDQQVTLLSPIAITKDNLNDAERLSEVK